MHGTRTWLAVVRAYHLCDAVMTQRLAALGVRIAEHEVLANLLREPGLSQQQLAARCFVAKSGVSMLLAQMEAAGLVRRDPDPADARAKRLVLTAKGSALARRTKAVQDEVVATMVEGASEADLAWTHTLMTQVAERLEALRAQQGVAPSRRSR